MSEESETKINSSIAEAKADIARRVRGILLDHIGSRFDTLLTGQEQDDMLTCVESTIMSDGHVSEVIESLVLSMAPLDRRGNLNGSGIITALSQIRDGTDDVVVKSHVTKLIQNSEYVFRIIKQRKQT